MHDAHTWYIIAVVAVITLLLRAFPFLIFSGERKTPKIIEKLSKILPCAVIGMLVVYCLKDVKITDASSVLPAIIASVVVAILYIWKRNTLVSTVCGTISYMLLVQLVF